MDATLQPEAARVWTSVLSECLFKIRTGLRFRTSTHAARLGEVARCVGSPKRIPVTGTFEAVGGSRGHGLGERVCVAAPSPAPDLHGLGQLLLQASAPTLYGVPRRTEQACGFGDTSDRRMRG